MLSKPANPKTLTEHRQAWVWYRVMADGWNLAMARRAAAKFTLADFS